MSQISVNPSTPRELDVSQLPDSAFDWRDPVWWGNTLAILIETTTIALLVAGYFYIRRNYTVFPPPKVDTSPPVFDTAPRLMWGTINVILMVLSCVPMYITDRFARRVNRPALIVGVGLMTLIGVATVWLRTKEFPALIFWWNDNAYASCIWTMMGLHFTYLIAATLEFFIMWLWMVLKGLDEHHSLDVTLAGGYWYWTAATGLVVYAVVYFGPKVL